MPKLLNDIENETAKELKKASLPLIKYLAENHHPHITARVTSTGVELVQGVLNVQNIYDFLKD